MIVGSFPANATQQPILVGARSRWESLYLKCFQGGTSGPTSKCLIFAHSSDLLTCEQYSHLRHWIARLTKASNKNGFHWLEQYLNTRHLDPELDALSAMRHAIPSNNLILIAHS